MPIVDGKTVSPDHAVHQGLCPECGSKLDSKSALSHAQGHWGMDPNSSHLSEEGRRRFNLVLDFIEIAKPKPRLEGEGNSRRHGGSMGEAEKDSIGNTAFLIIVQIAIAGVVEAAMWTLVGDLPRYILWTAVVVGSVAILAINFRQSLASYRLTFSLTQLMIALLALSVVGVPIYGAIRWALRPVPNQVGGHPRDFDTGEIIGSAVATPATPLQPVAQKSPLELVTQDDFATRERFRPVLMDSMKAGRPHPVEIVAALEAQTFAVRLAGWIAMSGWQPREHGCQNCWVGVPTEHALSDGITISAHEDCLDAETIRFALGMIGINARPVVLPVATENSKRVESLEYLDSPTQYRRHDYAGAIDRFSACMPIP